MIPCFQLSNRRRKIFIQVKPDMIKVKEGKTFKKIINKMKRFLKLTGVLLMLLMVGNGCRYAHRGIKGMIDHNRMSKQGAQMNPRQMRGMGPGHMGPYMAQSRMNGMRGGMGMGPGRMGRMGQMMGRPGMNGMRGFMPRGPMNGMRGGFGANQMYGMRRGMGPNAFMWQGPMRPGRMIDRIPNLTDKQKKEIADLRQSQQAEMKKFMDDVSAKMKSLRESDRNKMLNLLTDEQKKFIESGSGNMNPSPDKAK
jgi:hypothetical protein